MSMDNFCTWAHGMYSGKADCSTALQQLMFMLQCVTFSLAGWNLATEKLFSVIKPARQWIQFALKKIKARNLADLGTSSTA